MAALQQSFRDAPAFIILPADWRAKTGLPGHPTEKNPVVERIYHSSLASAFLYLHLAAATLGLASQWYSAASRPDAECAIRKIIGIPQSLSIYDMMVLGYPAVAPNPKEPRSLVEMIHYDNCGPQDFRTGAHGANFSVDISRQRVWRLGVLSVCADESANCAFSGG
jgi:nitroreductase